MDKIRVSKVEDVTLWRRGTRFEGTLHLMPHHIVFSYFPPPPPGSTPSAKPPRQKEVWITYPMICYCVYRPTPPASRQAPSIRLRCRDFTFFAFHFLADNKAREVYDSIRSLSCRVGRLDKLLAFSYQPKPPEDNYNGWEVYDARKEFKRLGISPKDSDKGWRVSDVNKDFTYSPTYPAVLVVPSKISDNVLKYASKFRSKERIPALVYRHPINNCSITRSSQPLPGIRGDRNPQDEKLIAAIWATNKGWTPVTPNPGGSSPDSSVEHLTSSAAESSFLGVGETDSKPGSEDLTDSSEVETEGPRIYGAQQQNLIVDARPTVNAMAMQVVGRGSEDMKLYPGATKAFLGIDNIHVMRKSLDKLMEALRDSDVTPLPPNREALAKSGWLKHINNILEGASIIVRRIGILHSHVLIHCSDGWDRTSQLSALSQICLDPYYRTLEGFIVLVEKDWLSFGHMFRNRSGFLGSDKWFEIENERIERHADAGGKPSNAFENALRGAKGFFKGKNDSTDSLSTDTGELQSVTDGTITSDGSPQTVSSARVGASEQRRTTKTNEISPVFHQFLDATYQLVYQNPTRFEFNERFLRRLFYHLYSCQYGTFLFDSEKERVDERAAERTRSVWDYFLCRRSEFMNPKYDATVNDQVRGQERMIFPHKGEVRWWPEFFGRTDEEMNGGVGAFPMQSGTGTPTLTPATSNLSSMGNGRATPARSGTSTPLSQENVVAGTETAENATGVGTTVHPHLPTVETALQDADAEPAEKTTSSAEIPRQPSPMARLGADTGSVRANLGETLGQNLAAGMASLGIGGASSGSVSPARSKSPGVAEEVGLELQ